MRTHINATFPSIALVALMGACGGGAEKAPAPATEATTPAPATPTVAAATTVDSIGRAVYVTCTTCHQVDGKGTPGAFPPLAGSSIASGAPEIPIAIVLHGLTGPIKVSGADYNSVMVPWGAAFNDVQIAAVLTYVRSQWGNAAAPVTPEQVAKVRAATASRTTMWTWAELQAAKF